MEGRLVFETPWVGLAVGGIALALIAWAAWRLDRRGLGRGRNAVLTGLRMLALVVIAVLLARPVFVLPDADEAQRRDVILLVDRSASMGLTDRDRERFRDALVFARDEVSAAVNDLGLKVRPMVFDREVEALDAGQLAAAKPGGDGTDLGGAFLAAMSATTRSPAAVIVLSDGAANLAESNAAAVSGLLAAGTPVVSVGFGSDRGVETLNLLAVEAPDRVPPNSTFRVSARIEASLQEALPPFDLILLRDGQFSQRRTVEGVTGSRYWSESFELSEVEEGRHTYHVRIEPPTDRNVVMVQDSGKVTVAVSREQEVRVLYMQGALTWDFKFIGRALRGDPTVQVTGLSRTSERSVFRQNLESPGELLDGFPDDVAELAPFSVIVLSSLKPSQLSVAQQTAISRFCGDYGGGVLVIGGRGTFDQSWRGSELEKMLPVRFEEDRGVRGLDPPFQMRLTAEALADPIFEIAGAGETADAWRKLPTFDDYGRIAEVKAGATIWAVHADDVGPNGEPRILMAEQPYGSGTAVVIALQNLWKWRLAKEADQGQFDRFWRQLIRRLADAGRSPVRIEVLDQELRPGRTIRMTLAREVAPGDAEVPGEFTFRVSDGRGEIISEEKVDLVPGRMTEVAFVPEGADLYSLAVVGAEQAQVAGRVLEIREPNLEMQRTGRDMEILRQWSAMSGGSAWTVEEAREEPEGFAAALGDGVEAARRMRMRRVAVGPGGWAMVLAVAPLCAGWILRKRWMLR